MNLKTHPRYEQLAEKAYLSHKNGRSPEGITPEEIDSARLYSYAFRTHTIGAYHATNQALRARPGGDALAESYIQRAVNSLEDLADMGMESIPVDFRALISTFHRYDRGVRRAIDAIEQAYKCSKDANIARIGERFAELMGEISGLEGIYLTRDNGLPEQASFVIPSLGISIVPLAYGDHHSWNLAYLTTQNPHVPQHRHYEGVEIHLGFEPIEGYMILDDCKSPVTEGYALPVPPMTRHGWANTSGDVHHVPFVFGSLKQAGWGVFLDVEPQHIDLEQLKTVGRESWKMSHTVFLNREINALAKYKGQRRITLIPASVTDRNGSGGLELSISRINEASFAFPSEEFRIISVVHGRGVVKMVGVEQPIKPHDHFGVPGGITALMQQEGNEPLVVLDAVIKTTPFGKKTEPFTDY